MTQEPDADEGTPFPDEPLDPDEGSVDEPYEDTTDTGKSLDEEEPED